MRDLKIIQSLVGPVDYKDLRFIDYAICKNLGVFTPTLGPCSYSITPDHSHPAYMAIANLHSSCKVQLKENIIECEPHKLYLFAPGVVHHEIIEESFNRYFACLISPQLFNKIALLYTKVIPEFENTSYPLPEMLLYYLHDFIQEYEHYSHSRCEQMDLLAERITTIIVRTALAPEQSTTPISYGTLIDKAIHLMHVRFGNELTLEEIAEFCCISPSHFLRQFKKATDHTPMDFLKKIRLDKACKLLSRSDDSITEVAFQCGFNSSSYFSTAFLAEYKQSPSEYRTTLHTFSA